MSSTKQLLIAAKKLIENPEHWTRGSMARNAEQNPCPVDSEQVTCFCMMGAISAAHLKGSYSLLTPGQVWNVIAREIRTDSIGFFNDTHTHQEVLDVFDQTISHCS